MNNVIQLPAPDANAEVFGGCPNCGCTSRIWNIYKSHWAVCIIHKTKWYIGENLFSNWRKETEGDWLKNTYRLAEFKEVEPVYPKDVDWDKRLSSGGAADA